MEISAKNTTIIPGLISVVMANFNTREEYLRQAIESVLNQTYTDFEFIIIDDCSTDDSVSVIESYHDDRIILIKNRENMGLPKSLNKGIDMCRGEYIARFDSDDICLPERFAPQLEYMKVHPDVIVSGTGVEFIGDWEGKRNRKVILDRITDRERYRIQLLFYNRPMIFHPTAMLNRNLMLKYDISYDERYLYAQDYKLWVSCSDVADCAIMCRVLVKYRIHDSAITSSMRLAQLQCIRHVIQDQLDALHLTITDDDMPSYLCLTFNRKHYSLSTKKWVEDILRSNRIYRVYDQKVLKGILWEKWTRITYYGLVNSTSFVERVQIFISLPAFKYPRSFHIIFDNWHKKLKRNCKAANARG